MKTQDFEEDSVRRASHVSLDTPGGARQMDAEQREIGERGPSSVIGADIVVTGNIEATIDLHIEGKVVGDVRCATLILGESSSVSGRIYATRVKVSGTVEGAIETRDLAIEATARVNGEITYERLRVANGGTIEGNITRSASTEATEEAARLKLVTTATPSDTAAKDVAAE